MQQQLGAQLRARTQLAHRKAWVKWLAAALVVRAARALAVEPAGAAARPPAAPR